ncbi:glycerate kinase [Motilimonas pumila]|uniref:glycerate kinase n=1 Tax=Motilimonas pumila TaxID=2303987 RepID=UPI001E5069F7|nr:glycerate kinase [Motilimonas pumila]
MIAPDSFKHSLSALEAAQAMEQGFRYCFPDAEYHLLPLADGGEGTLTVLQQCLSGEEKSSVVLNAIGEPVTASWLWLPAHRQQAKATAYIELARAAGLAQLPLARRQPLVAHTYGCGQLIQAALEQGAEKIVLGLGGSASTDGGSGMLQALGAKLLDKQGQPLELGGGALSALASIDLSQLHARCSEVEMVLACDVSNPLLGPRGASQVFAPQKGASPQQIIQLESGLRQFAQVCADIAGLDKSNSPSFGAAGGSPLGLNMAFNVTIVSGIEMMLALLNAARVLQGADLVVTGEGQMDGQTLQGKAPWGITQLAQQQGIPVIAIAGAIGADIAPVYQHISAAFSCVPRVQPLTATLAQAKHNVMQTARNVASAIQLGSHFKA